MKDMKSCLWCCISDNNKRYKTIYHAYGAVNVILSKCQNE